MKNNYEEPFVCKKCVGRIVMPAYGEGKCKICDNIIQEFNLPIPKLCTDCSLEFGLCHVCGEKIKE